MYCSFREAAQSGLSIRDGRAGPGPGRRGACRNCMPPESCAFAFLDFRPGIRLA